MSKSIVWNLGNHQSFTATEIGDQLTVNGYKENDFVITKNEAGQLVLTDAIGGTISISNWSGTTLKSVKFAASGYSKTLAKSTIDARLFNGTLLANEPGEMLIYNEGLNRRQQFDIAFSEDTNIVIESASNTEDRIRFSNNWRNDREDLFVSGPDLVIRNWDPETGEDVPGQLVIADYMNSSVKTIEFSNQTYRLVTESGSYTGSDTVSERYVFVDGVKSNGDPGTPDWDVTLSGLTAPGMAPDWIDFRGLPVDSRFYSLNGTPDGQDMVLLYTYAPDGNDSEALGRIRIKDFFNADGTVNSANGYPLIRVNREFYAGNGQIEPGPGKVQFDGLWWERVRYANGEPERNYRRVMLNAGSANADTADLANLVKTYPKYSWLYYAGGGNDTITSHEGDIVYGGKGDDTLKVQGRMANVQGGDGNDTITVQAADGTNLDRVVVRGGGDNDVINAYGSYFYLGGNKGDDEIHLRSKAGSAEVAHDSFASGGYGNDTIYIHAGHDQRVNGGSGEDTLFAYLGSNHILTGGYDNDEIHIVDDGTKRSKNNRANGGQGDDKLYIENGGLGHFLYGYDGNDYLSVEGDKNYLDGGIGNDTLKVVSGKNNELFGGDGDDKLNSGAGVDTLHGGTGTDTIYGGEGNDFLYGDEGDDILYGQAGKDKVYGGDGADGLCGGSGDDILYGQAGNDTLKGYEGNDQLYGGSGNDKLYGENGNDTLKGYDGNDVLYGGSADDILYGEAGNDTLYGQNGDDTLTGGAGKDMFVYATGEGADTIADYTAGDDTIQITDGSISKSVVSGKDVKFTVGSGSITLTGGAGKTISIKDSRGTYTVSNTAITLGKDFTGTLDAAMYLSTVGTVDGSAATKATTLKGNAKANTINGGSGKDTIYGYDGNDTLKGNVGNDVLYGQVGNDKIYGGDGADKLYSGSGDDIVYGQAGNDILKGYDGDDQLYGGSGNDTLYGENGSDTLKGYDGNDMLYGEEGDDKLYGEAGDDFIYGDNGIDTLYGGGGNDRIFGGPGDDMLYGDNDDDTLYGGEGNDIIYGGDGIDRIYGGAGNNTLYDGNDDKSKDYFCFGYDSTGTNTIYGYTPGYVSNSDIIHFSDGISVSSSGDSGNDYVMTLSTGGSIRLIGCAGAIIRFDTNS